MDKLDILIFIIVLTFLSIFVYDMTLMGIQLNQDYEDYEDKVKEFRDKLDCKINEIKEPNVINLECVNQVIKLR